MIEEKDMLITQNVLYVRLCDCAFSALSTKSEQLDAILDRKNRPKKYTYKLFAPTFIWTHTAYVTTEFNL